MGQRHDTPQMERRQHIAARILCVLMALLVALAAVLLYTGIGEGSLSTNGVRDSVETVKVNKPFYVLLIGSDSLKGTALYTGDSNEDAQVEQHADAVTLVRVDPKKYRLTLVTVPPYTMLSSNKEDGTIADTLLSNDPEATVAAVEELTGVKIPYYLLVNYSGFEKVVDALETITVDVDVAVRSQDPISAKNVSVKPGDNQELYASGALAYARAWNEYSSNKGRHRQHNVRAIEKAIVTKVLASNEGTAASLADLLSENVRTNMDASLIRSLTKSFAQRGVSRVKVYQCTGPDKVIDKDTGVVKRDKKSWKQLMYVVKRGYNPAKTTYAQLKEQEAQKAAEQAQREAEEQAAQQGYGYDAQQGDQGQQGWQDTQQQQPVQQAAGAGA